MPINPSEKNIYESFEMYHPNGIFMSFVAKKRAFWYVERGLATWIDDKKFKLNFEPNGFGKSEMPFYNQKLENRCVVCGVEDAPLNKHHVVPYVFRSRFPKQYKESNHHDILVTCVECHENYESHAMQFKIDLVTEAGFSMGRKLTADERFNNKIKSAKKMLNKINSGEIEPNLIPLDKINEFKKLSEMTEKDVKKDDYFWADKLMDNIKTEEEIFSFVKMWRKHFVEHANPRFLPKHWSVDHPLELS